jgi:transposase InsO family protein
MENTTADQHAMAVALARYAVIAPLVSRNLSRDEYRKERDKILACTHKFPGEAERLLGRRTVERWLGRYRNGRSNDEGVVQTEPGLEALKPTPRADCGSARALSPELIDRAVRLRMELPTRSTQTIVNMLKAEAAARREEEPRIEVPTLAYQLRARRRSRRHLKQEGRAYPRYEHPYRNAVWQGDWSKGIALPDPTRPGKTRFCHLHAFIDDHSRFVPHAEFYFRQNLPCLEDCFRKAILKSGIPERVYWDNGAVYQARQIQLLAGRLGTHVIFATPYAPEGKGKIERFFRTTKDAFYPEATRAGLQTLEEVNHFFWGWLEDVYHARVHSESEQTPRQRWETGVDNVRMPDPASLVDLFLWEETRKVDKTGCVKMAGNAYAVGEHMVGHAVQVRYDPFDLARVRIYAGGTFVECVTALKLVANTLRKAKPRRKERSAALDSSVAYGRTISAEYRRKVEATITQARPAVHSRNHCLTRSEFAAHLSLELGDRQLTAAESAAIADFFARHAPLRVETVMLALSLAVEEKGIKRHIRFYLDAVRSLRMREEGK